MTDTRHMTRGLVYLNSDEEPPVDQSLGGEVSPSKSESDNGDELGHEVGDQGGDEEVGGEEVCEGEDENLEDRERDFVSVEETGVEGVMEAWLA